MSHKCFKTFFRTFLVFFQYFLKLIRTFLELIRTFLKLSSKICDKDSVISETLKLKKQKWIVFSCKMALVSSKIYVTWDNTLQTIVN